MKKYALFATIVIILEYKNIYKVLKTVESNRQKHTKGAMLIEAIDCIFTASNMC